MRGRHGRKTIMMELNIRAYVVLAPACGDMSSARNRHISRIDHCDYAVV